jgi:hypothetical protein
MRHRSIALPLAVLASLVLASVAAAGGWAQVSAKNMPVDPPAGEPTTIELAVSQHGVTAVSWPDLTVIATNEASGDVIRVAAEAKGPVGAYIATIVFPSEGQWVLTFDSTDLEMAGWAPIQIAPTVAAAPAGAGAGTPNQATAAAPLATEVMAVLLVLFVLVVGAGLVALGVRNRGGSADAPVSASDSPVSART